MSSPESPRFSEDAYQEEFTDHADADASVLNDDEGYGDRYRPSSSSSVADGSEKHGEEATSYSYDGDGDGDEEDRLVVERTAAGRDLDEQLQQSEAQDRQDRQDRLNELNDDDIGLSDLEQSDEENEERNEEDIRQALEEREHLLAVNQERQQKILFLLERDKHNKRNEAEEKIASTQSSNLEQVRAQYLKSLDQLTTLWDRIEHKREEAEDKIVRLTSKLDSADRTASDLAHSFKAFKRAIAVEAIHSRTGKPIKMKHIRAMEAEEDARDREVAEVRLKHINLLTQLKQQEDEVKQREELAEGLHLIDFEQLKIENQTLNEKIEERNDELHKLKKKTTTTVQVLTHVKEKLQFVEQQNAVIFQSMDQLDGSVEELREKLTRIKKVRDKLRQENSTLKQKQGFIGSDLLVADFESRKGSLQSVQAKVDALKNKHAKLASIVAQAAPIEQAMHQQTIQMLGGNLGNTLVKRRG